MVTAGAAVVLVGAGVFEGLRARSASQEVEDDAAAHKQFNPAVESRGTSAEQTQWVLLGAGALVGAAGAALWLYGSHLASEPPAAARGVTVAPILSPRNAGAYIRLTF